MNATDLLELLKPQLDGLTTISYIILSADFLFALQIIQTKEENNGVATFFGVTISRTRLEQVFIVASLFLLLYYLMVMMGINHITEIAKQVIKTKDGQVTYNRIRSFIIYHPAPLNPYFFSGAELKTWEKIAVYGSFPIQLLALFLPIISMVVIGYFRIADYVKANYINFFISITVRLDQLHTNIFVPKTNRKARLKKIVANKRKRKVSTNNQFRIALQWLITALSAAALTDSLANIITIANPGIVKAIKSLYELENVKNNFETNFKNLGYLSIIGCGAYYLFILLKNYADKTRTKKSDDYFREP